MSQGKTGGRVMIATTPEIPGYEIVEYKGLVWGITVRCKNFFVDYLSSWRQISGGEMKGYSTMSEEARQQALDRMISSARKQGANAVIEVIFDSEFGGGGSNNQSASSTMTAYGTAVLVREVE